MPTFCRHNRFLERCPVCSKTLPAHAPDAAQTRGGTASRTGTGTGATSRHRRARGESVRVQHEGRAQDDGYRTALLPGLRASADAGRLAAEISFSSARLLALESNPPGLYGEVKSLAASDLERATWACFLIAYLSPRQGEDPFAGIRGALAASPALGAADGAGGGLGSYEPEGRGRAPELQEIFPGPRSSHDPSRGEETLIAYRQWVRRSGGTQAAAFLGDPTWSPERRFARVFERLALPGLARMGRYELLVTLGHLGLYELRADSLHLAGARGLSADDLTTMAAKRLFAIGDPLLLERRAAALAQAVGVPVEVLDLALANWASPERATLGFSPAAEDEGAHHRAREALGL